MAYLIFDLCKAETSAYLLFFPVLFNDILLLFFMSKDVEQWIIYRINIMEYIVQYYVCFAVMCW
jgi:hypothetical protein